MYNQDCKENRYQHQHRDYVGTNILFVPCWFSHGNNCFIGYISLVVVSFYLFIWVYSANKIKEENSKK